MMVTKLCLLCIYVILWLSGFFMTKTIPYLLCKGQAAVKNIPTHYHNPDLKHTLEFSINMDEGDRNYYLQVGETKPNA